MAIESAAQQDQQDLERKIVETLAKMGMAPSSLPPRFGSTGFLDPTLEYFVRNELEKLETRFGAKLEKTEAGLKEHLEKELRKVSDSFGDRINKAVMWGIMAAIAVAGAAITVAHYWAIPSAGK